MFAKLLTKRLSIIIPEYILYYSFNTHKIEMLFYSQKFYILFKRLPIYKLIICQKYILIYAFYYLDRIETFLTKNIFYKNLNIFVFYHTSFRE